MEPIKRRQTETQYEKSLNEFIKKMNTAEEIITELEEGNICSTQNVMQHTMQTNRTEHSRNARICLKVYICVTGL